MTDQELMQNIKAQWGALFVQVTQDSALKPGFLAALTANESAGNAAASRYEPRVMGQLAEVALGIKPNYGSITTSDLLPIGAPAALEVLQTLRNWATSWGLVQIMGYEVIPFKTVNGVQDLKSPVTELPIACRMLADFGTRNGLDLGSSYAELFDCWNTGRPHAPTADPAYIPNGLKRMELYAAL